MPGLASTADLRQPRAAIGRDLDVLFLQLMVRHHEAGVPMLRDAVARADQPVVRNLAIQMLSAQTADSASMRHMLAERGALPLPA